MSRIHNSGALPYSCEQRAELDYQADLWTVPWRKLGFGYCGIYLITPEGMWPVKIGISEDAASRLNSLQTSHWHQMRIVDYWICENKTLARKLEATAHDSLADRRMMGEWFDIKSSKAAEAVEFQAGILGIELAKRLPDTAKFDPVRAHVESFYNSRHMHLDRLGKI
jgi:hypothetical protein